MVGQDWAELVKVFGIPLVLLAFTLWALSKKLWAPGWVVLDLQARLEKSENKLDQYNAMAWGMMETNSKAVQALADAAQAARAAPGSSP